MELVVLGAGLVGNAIVRDLAAKPDYHVTAVDIRPDSLARLKGHPSVSTVRADIVPEGVLEKLIAPADLVVCAVPGWLGFETVRRIITSGKDVVDISFFPEDALELGPLAKKTGVTAIVDCGVAPGLCNIQAGYMVNRMEKTESYLCYVGGLPRVREWPYEYKAPFSPADVLEEYTRPARYVENGKVIVVDALSDPEFKTFPDIGTLEAFNTDGVRSMMKTLDIPNMKEKTMRYPGYANLMRIFRQSGFFATDPVEVDGQSVIPLSLTSRLLFDQWKLGPEDEDLTVMQVVVIGQLDGQRTSVTFDLLDRYDASTKTSSMARTTGYTCAIVARQLLRGLIAEKGVVPPEILGRIPGCYENLLEEYQKRDIHIQETTEPDTCPTSAA